MCLAAVAWQRHPQYPLIIIANRDEFHHRPTANGHWWPDYAPAIFAGKDQQAGGTWLGINKTGRFALLTNFRDPPNIRPDAQSRGDLPIAFLTADTSVAEFRAQWQPRKTEFNGFNLLMFDGHTLGYMSSEPVDQTALMPGVYGLSNAVLNSPWPKTLRLQQGLQGMLSPQPEDTASEWCINDWFTNGFATLADRTSAPAAHLPNTGLEQPFEQLLSSPFIVSPNYGTRASYVMLYDHQQQWHIAERTFTPAGDIATEQSITSQP